MAKAIETKNYLRVKQITSDLSKLNMKIQFAAEDYNGNQNYKMQMSVIRTFTDSLQKIQGETTMEQSGGSIDKLSHSVFERTQRLKSYLNPNSMAAGES